MFVTCLTASVRQRLYVSDVCHAQRLCQSHKLSKVRAAVHDVFEDWPVEELESRQDFQYVRVVDDDHQHDVGDDRSLPSGRGRRQEMFPPFWTHRGHVHEQVGGFHEGFVREKILYVRF